MSITTRVSAMSLAIAALCAGPAPAADAATLLKDLTSVIMLLGMPCGQVVSARRQADNDHIASCENGNRYRVFINAQGRAAAKKL